MAGLWAKFRRRDGGRAYIRHLSKTIPRRSRGKVLSRFRPRSSSVPSATEREMDYENEAKSRTFLAFFHPPAPGPSSFLSARSYGDLLHLLKVPATVARKVPDKKKSFGIMVIR